MSELQRLVPVARIVGGFDQLVEATPEECLALASRMGVPAVLSLRCRFQLHAVGDGVVAAEGVLRAIVIRECVVSLDQFDTTLHERFRVRFVPADQESDDPDPESDDEIPYEGAAVDLGEAAAEQLGLALDPYPRKPGVALPDPAGDAAGSPFAALARLRKPN